MVGRESMRDNYKTFGVDGYYTANSETYRNPHFPDLIRVVSMLMTRLMPHLSGNDLSCSRASAWNDEYSFIRREPTEECDESKESAQLEGNCLRILDLACGSGEASLSIANWFRKSPSASSISSLAITATDPYTQAAYTSRTGGSCLPHSFVDVSAGALSDEYDICIVSFALHLADDSLIYSLMQQMALQCRFFIVTSPHKKPIIKDMGCMTLIDHFVAERIHVRIFKSNYVS